MDPHFGGIIWTNHALSRMRERGIKQGDAWATWRNPEQSRYAEARGAWIYYRTYGSERIEVVAKHLPAQAGNEKREWLILSVWSRPVYQRHEAKSASFWSGLLHFLFGN